jgi:hypothetical protein
MFNLGPIEILLILTAGYLAFRHWIARRYPNFRRAFNFVFFTSAALMILFSLFSHRG